MKTYTISDIRELKPCYDPSRHLPEDWTGTPIDLLKIDHIPPEDRLWVVSQWLDDRTLRLFTVWCAREALKLVDEPDSRSIVACDTAERYAYGKASKEDLKNAWQNALEAARAAAREAARAAAWAAAWAAAREAAWTAARAAAREAARAAAWAAARAAAREAAREAARAAAWCAQIQHLTTMITKSERST